MAKVVFYALFGTAAALGVYFAASSLFGWFALGAASPTVSKAILLVCALAGAGALYWAYRLGELHGQWLAGIGAVLLTVLLFQLLMVAGRWLFG